MSRPTFNLIGAGRLGRSLGWLWQSVGAIELGDFVCRSEASAATAQAFLGGGRVATFESLRPADITLIATPDDAVSSMVTVLANRQRIRAGDVVFHCSGALSSAELAPLQAQGALIASVHPLKSFADPMQAVRNFTGTFCGCEGDEAALARLAPLWDAIGAKRFPILAEHKVLYHAGAVMACNQLVALMAAALDCMAAAGVATESAWPALRPLIDGTLSNIDQMGVAKALTGPVARGDVVTVSRQLAAVAALDPAVASAYRSLSVLTLQLAELTPDQRAALANLLEQPN